MHLNKCAFFPRCFPLPGNTVRPPTGLRVLPDPGLRTKHARRHPILGILLDQRRGVPSPCLHRSAHRPHDDDPEHRRQRRPTQGLLHQGHRRLDVHVFDLRVHRPARVRRRQRAIAEEERPYPPLDPQTPVWSTHDASGPSPSDTDAEQRREPTRSGGLRHSVYTHSTALHRLTPIKIFHIYSY